MPTELTVSGRRIRLGPEIGRGATSAVFRVDRDGEPCALKLGQSAAQRPRFAEEAARLFGVSSERVVRLIDAGVMGHAVELPGGQRAEPGAPFLLTEQVNGEALDPVAVTEDARRELALVLARDLGQALADLHAAGVAHGDVKPANAVVEHDASGRPLRATLVDLGLSTEGSEVTVRGGTRRYLPPEAYQGSGDARLRDLWALGLLLAETLSGEVARAPLWQASLEPALAKQGELGEASSALLSTLPALRPSAAWVSALATRLSGHAETPEARRLRRLAGLRRAYLAVRRDEIVVAARHVHATVEVAGEPGAWLTDALALARAIGTLRGDEPGQVANDCRLRPLAGHALARLVVLLVGPAAASWPLAGDETALMPRLFRALAEREPEALRWLDLTGPPAAPSLAEPDVVELALKLERGLVDPQDLELAEARVQAGGAPAALGLGLLRTLRLRGELGRALAVSARVPSDEAQAERAEIFRRAGDFEQAERVALSLLERGASGAVRARAVSTAARIALDRGDTERALGLLPAEPDAAGVFETRALVELRRERHESALELVNRARAFPASDEERARLEAVRGNVLHAAADAENALVAFRMAAELASRAGAVLEEATYSTGVAAAATAVGALGEAASSARRAVLLFEALGRRGEAARAMLSVAASHVAAGAFAEAREAAGEAQKRAKAAGDRRCAAFAHLVLADAAELAPSPAALEHARWARSQVEAGGEDALRAAARLWLHGERELDVAAFDALARAGAALDARLEWWGARAEVELRRDHPESAEALCSELVALASGPVLARGPALSAGARLAARTGDGDTARRLALAASDAARELLRRAPPALRGAIESLPWVRASEAARLESPLSAEQIGDAESLVRALGRRDHLRALLRQVVDALVLWTGVERGLLLLRAPGGRLKPRAARNLARADLTREQLELSRSLAERALELGEPVVAVDAAGDLPDVHASVHALKLRSVLAVPLVAHGEALGVVYLDDRVRRGAFGPAELGWVRLVATVAAVAIADARAQLFLRRAARRAERAEARLSEELARREAELDVAERELARAASGRRTRFSYDAIVGESEAIAGMLKVVDRVTPSEVPVLVVGESGSGKELVARAIHENGPRGHGPFVSENCGAVPETLLESTLFGHVRGAFTGAVRPRAGLFEVAHRGTLLLDEIAEMSLGMQAKLLRALQNGEIRPVGSESVRRVDVRVIGATHRDLDALVAAGRFREDLFYRLNVILVRVPSLRERPGDVPLLARHFLEAHAGERKVKMAKSALDALSAYAWPGNVRQLENEVRRALVLCDETIQVEHLSPEVRDRAQGEAARVDGLNLRRRVDALETELVRSALRRTGGNQTRAAELLGVSRFGLQKMMKRLEISLESSAL